MAAGHDSLAVTGFGIILMIIMATGALADYFCLVVVPVGMGVDVIVTVGAGDFIELVYARIMLLGFFFVASDALRFGRHDIA